MILAKTIKGYAFGAAAEAVNAAHQVKKLDIDSLKKFRDRFGIPIKDAKLEAQEATIEKEVAYRNGLNNSPAIFFGSPH